MKCVCVLCVREGWRGEGERSWDKQVDPVKESVSVVVIPVGDGSWKTPWGAVPVFKDMCGLSTYCFMVCM